MSKVTNRQCVRFSRQVAADRLHHWCPFALMRSRHGRRRRRARSSSSRGCFPFVSMPSACDCKARGPSRPSSQRRDSVLLRSSKVATKGRSGLSRRWEPSHRSKTAWNRVALPVSNDLLAAKSALIQSRSTGPQPLQSGHRHRNFDWRQRVVQRRPALSSGRLGMPLRAGTGHSTGRLAIVTCRRQPRIEHQDSATSSHSRASAMPPTDLVAARCAAASPALRTKVEP